MSRLIILIDQIIQFANIKLKCLNNLTPEDLNDMVIPLCVLRSVYGQH